MFCKTVCFLYAHSYTIILTVVKVCEAEPLLTRYVAQWPVQWYIRQYLSTRKYKLKEQEASVAEDQRAARPNDNRAEAAQDVGPRETAEHPAYSDVRIVVLERPHAHRSTD